MKLLSSVTLFALLVTVATASSKVEHKKGLPAKVSSRLPAVIVSAASDPAVLTEPEAHAAITANTRTYEYSTVENGLLRYIVCPKEEGNDKCFYVDVPDDYSKQQIWSIIKAKLDGRKEGVERMTSFSEADSAKYIAALTRRADRWGKTNYSVRTRDGREFMVKVPENCTQPQLWKAIRDELVENKKVPIQSIYEAIEQHEADAIKQMQLQAAAAAAHRATENTAAQAIDEIAKFVKDERLHDGLYDVTVKLGYGGSRLQLRQGYTQKELWDALRNDQYSRGLSIGEVAEKVAAAEAVEAEAVYQATVKSVTPLGENRFEVILWDGTRFTAAADEELTEKELHRAIMALVPKARSDREEAEDAMWAERDEIAKAEAAFSAAVKHYKVDDYSAVAPGKDKYTITLKDGHVFSVAAPKVTAKKTLYEGLLKMSKAQMAKRAASNKQ